MAAKDDILSAIRRQTVPLVDLPDLDRAWIQFDDPRRQFVETLASVGGRGVNVASAAEIPAQLDALEQYASAKKIVSLVDGVGRNDVDLDRIDDPHALDDVDFAVAGAELAVAENGAVYVSDAQLRHRVLYFIVRHLAIVVPAECVVHNMHEAYVRLHASDPDRFLRPGFGAFLSGPSKTADIEQSLVVGAHGARTVTVFLVGS